MSRASLKAPLIAIFSGLWLIDATATVSFVASHGAELEANPFMRALIDAVGVGGFALTKAGVLIFWLTVGRFAHTWIHGALVLVMAPVTWAAVTVAWGGV